MNLTSEGLCLFQKKLSFDWRSSLKSLFLLVLSYSTLRWNLCYGFSTKFDFLAFLFRCFSFWNILSDCSITEGECCSCSGIKEELLTPCLKMLVRSIVWIIGRTFLKDSPPRKGLSSVGVNFLKIKKGDQISYCND